MTRSGGNASVSPREDRRLLREPAEVALTGRVQERGADDPAEREPRRGAEQDAPGGVGECEAAATAG